MSRHGPSDDAATPAGGGQGAPEGIGAGEIAAVCARYDIGAVRAVHDLRRGSEASPKVVLHTSAGVYLLKRRAASAGAPLRVALSHDIQLFLSRRGFPSPRLLGTRLDRNTMVRIGPHVYELFEFIPGGRPDDSPQAAAAAGAALGALHHALSEYRGPYDVPAATYHRLGRVEEWLRAARNRLGRPSLRPVIRSLGALYEEAGVAADRAGLPSLPAQVIHADWHPGNLIYRDGRIVGVVDFDTAAWAPRVVDAANGALQFSIRRSMFGDGGGAFTPLSQGEGLALDRFTAFWRGYHEKWGGVPLPADRDAVPWLMIEAIIAEATAPIAATGQIGGVDGTRFLPLIERQARWLRENVLLVRQLVVGGRSA